MTVSECKNYNFQTNEKISLIANFFFWADLFASLTYFSTMVWLKNIFNCQFPVNNINIFYSPSHLSILNIGKFLNSWIIQAKTLYMTLKTKC